MRTRPSAALAALVVASAPACKRSEPAPAATPDAATVVPDRTPIASSEPRPKASAPASPVREEKTVVVDGVTETWRLVWRKPPELTCVDEHWSTCLCAGYAFGETGPMDLVRVRPGAPEERLDLNRFDEQLAIRRWLPIHGDTREKIPLGEIQARPVAEVMKLGDYDHDGRATEFVLQVGPAGPCGHVSTILVGISRREPKLHAFTTVDKPREWLVLGGHDDWEAVRASVPAQLVEVACGDHGATTEESITVMADAAGLHATRRERACP